METFVLAFLLICAAFAGLGVGVLTGRPPLTGSCGGLGCKGLGACQACPNKSRKDGP